MTKIYFGYLSTGSLKQKIDDNDDNYNEPPVKQGQAMGAGKWHDEDFTAMLDLAEELVGKKEWVALYVHFTEWAWGE